MSEGERETKSYILVRKPAERTCYDVLMSLTDGHLCEIYGAYGTGKSRLVHHIAVEAQNAGKRVIYIDTEGGLTEQHARMLKDYWYVGDEMDALEEAVAKARDMREGYDLLVVDSVGHPVYVNYVELEGMQDKLRAYQRLAMIFRDMVRFARGERGKDLGSRRALAIATNHPVSEFARDEKDLPSEEPLDPFGGQIHRVPKLILRSEPAGTWFRLVAFKARNLPRGVEVARFRVADRVTVEWRI